MSTTRKYSFPVMVPPPEVTLSDGEYELMYMEGGPEQRPFLFWGATKFQDSENRVVPPSHNNRIVRGTRGKNFYVFHAICANPNDRQPFDDFGLLGDIWLTLTRIYWRDHNGWREWTVDQSALGWDQPSSLPSHPLWPDKKLAFNLPHLCWGWFVTATVRSFQYANKWSMAALLDIPEIKTFEETIVGHEDIIKILSMDYTRLLPLHRSYLSCYLLFIYSESIPQPTISNTPPSGGSSAEGHLSSPIVIPSLPSPIPASPSVSLSLGGNDEEDNASDEPTVASSPSSPRFHGSLSPEIPLPEDLCANSHVPTYSQFDKHTYAAEIPGRISSGTVAWFNSALTQLPSFTSSTGQLDMNCPDVKMVKWMAAGRDATLPGPDAKPSQLVVLNINDPDSFEELSSVAKDAQACIANGQAVLVRPSENLRGFSWNTQSIQRIIGFNDNCFHASASWQTTKGRHIFRQSTTAEDDFDDEDPTQVEPEINWRALYKKGTIAEFLDDVDRAEDSVNLLDLPLSNPWIDPFISSFIAVDLHAWTATSRMGYSHHIRPPPKRRDFGKVGSRVAKELTQEQVMKATFATFNGPSLIEHDTTKQRSWCLLTSDQFYTYPHYDGSGVGTFMVIAAGMKIWSYVEAKDKDEGEEKASSAYIDLAAAATAKNYNYAPEDVPDVATAHNIFLTPGALLIQPPGKVHQVYTPCKTISLGGHFMTEASAHVMEWIRILSHLTGGMATNANHSGFYRSLARMVFYMVIRSPLQVYLKPFLALARMITWPFDYIKADFDADENVKLSNETLWELHDAQTVVELILIHNGIELRPVEVHWDTGIHRMNARPPRSTLVGWVIPSNKGRNDHWYERGNDTIDIPAVLSERYREYDDEMDQS